MSATDVARPHFRERQVVDAATLTAEQSYLVAMRRRHDIAAHSWGIVTGLAPAVVDGVLAVQPGLAVDGFGRELVLAAATRVAGEAFDALGADSARLWILYGRLGSGRTARWTEEPCLRLTTADGDVDPWAPPGVTDVELGFDATSEPPDGSSPPWPVYLGIVRRDGDPAQYSVDLSGRPYAGAVGELLTEPKARASVRLGPGGFAFRRAAGVEEIAVDGAGSIAITGQTGILGDLALPAVTGEALGVGFRQIDEPPAARPWSMYRTTRLSDGKHIRQLRVEIGTPEEKGDPARYAFAIGSTDDSGRFRPCLRITPDCVVAVGGRVTVEGVLVRGPVAVDANDPRFGAAVLAGWLRGIANAGGQLDDTYAGAVSLQAEYHADGGTRAVAYDVTVSNTGRVQLSGVLVTAHVFLTGLQVLSRTLHQGFTLAPGADRGLTGSWDLSEAVGDAGHVELAVTATGPTGYPSTDADSQQFEFQAVPL